MAKTTEQPLNNRRAVAVMLLSIDQDLAAKVLQSLSDDQLGAITRAMRELQEARISPDNIAETYRMTIRRLKSDGMALGDVSNRMQKVLVRAFGEERGMEMGERVDHEILARRPFAVFESLGAEDLANLLTEEHPQIAAVFLAHLDRSKAGRVLKHLPAEQRPEMLHRVATLDRTPPDVVQRVLDVMRTKVKNLGLTTLRSEPKAWIKAAAEILNGMGGGEKEVLEAVADRDDQIAGAIRDEMFTFDDMAKLDRKSMQKILGQIETRDLAVALKAASAEVEANILGSLSKRAGDMVIEERDALGPMPLSEVLEAQASLVSTVRDAVDRGEIQLTGVGEQLV